MRPLTEGSQIRYVRYVVDSQLGDIVRPTIIADISYKSRVGLTHNRFRFVRHDPGEGINVELHHKSGPKSSSQLEFPDMITITIPGILPPCSAELCLVCRV